MKLEHFLTSCTKINSKWIKDLNVRPETSQLLEGKHRQNTQLYKLKEDPYDTPPRVVEIKTHVYKWDLIKFKSFLM